MRDTLLEAHAVRIYGIAKPKGWRVSLAHLERALKLPRRDIKAVIEAKGWTINSHSESLLDARQEDGRMPPVDHYGTVPVDQQFH